MPVFNEQETIEKVLNSIESSLNEPAVVYLVGDNHLEPTFDVAREVSKELSIKVCCIVQEKEIGPASAIKLGIKLSTEKYIVLLTADDSDDAGDIPKLLSELRNGATLACASRYSLGGQHLGGPRLKFVLSKLAGLIAKQFRQLATSDPTNLFKAVNRNFIESIEIESKKGFTIGLELVGKVNSHKLTISEIPTVWRERREGISNFKIFRWLPTYIYWFLRLLFSK